MANTIHYIAAGLVPTDIASVQPSGSSHHIAAGEPPTDILPSGQARFQTMTSGTIGASVKGFRNKVGG